MALTPAYFETDNVTGQEQKLVGSGGPLVSNSAWLSAHAEEHAAMGLNKAYPYILSQGGTPIGIAPTGSVGANGAITLGTALNIIYAGGVWLYFPTGAVFAASTAAFYYCVMSSTTVGTCYANTYVAETSSYAFPASPTAIVDAGPGAYTGSTSEITAVSVTLPGGALGINGVLTHEYRDARSNTAGAKTVKAKLGGTISVFNNAVASNASYSAVNSLRNMGTESRQSCVQGLSDSSTGSTTAVTAIAVDTSVDQVVSFTLQLAVATDFVVMNGYSLIVKPM